jgi:predicted ATP-grasp superfamily ATP-dependent carboligase
MPDETELEQAAEQSALDAADSVFDWQVAWTRPKPLSVVEGAPRVLVVGIVSSLTWSVTRCLSRAGMRPVVMGWHRYSPLSLLPDCKYVPMRSVRWNDAEIDPSAIDEIARVCRTHAIDKVIPVDFPTVMLLSRYGDAISGTSVAAVPQADTMLALHNKWQFSRAIERMGLPQPRTELARSRSDLLATRLAFPIVTKPVDGWAGVGFCIHEDAAALARRLDAGKLAADFPLLVQEYIPGRDVGFAFLARHGQLVAHVAFEQTRRGARRCYDAPVLHQYVAKLLAATGYHGIGEVDARYDPTRDEYRLLEVNPRFWASLLYAERAGINFPELLVHLDDLEDDLGVVAEPDEVRLSPYEVMVAKSVQWTERAHNTVHGWFS